MNTSAVDTTISGVSDRRARDETMPRYYRGPTLPEEVTNSIWSYPHINFVRELCAEQQVNLFLFGSARDRILFQDDVATMLDPKAVGDLDFVVPLAGGDFSMFCTILNLKILNANCKGLKLRIDTKNTFPQAHIVQNGEKIISLYGTFDDAKNMPEVERVMNRLSTSPTNVEQTAICLPYNNKPSYVISPFRNFKYGKQNIVELNPTSPQVEPGVDTAWYFPSLDLGRWLDRQTRVGLPSDFLTLCMRRIFDQYKLMDLGVFSFLYREEDFFKNMTKRVASFLAIHEIFKNPCKIGTQEVLFSNYVIPLSEIPAILVQFPFLQKYYEDIVGLPINFNDEDLLTSDVFTQIPESERQNRIQALNRLLVFNSLVTSLAERGYVLRNISEYVGFALASAVLADDLMDISDTEFKVSLDTYWDVESPENPLYDLAKVWKRMEFPEVNFDSKFIAIGPGSYEEYRNLILTISATMGGVKNVTIDSAGILDIPKLKKEIVPLVGQYFSVQRLGLPGPVLAIT